MYGYPHKGPKPIWKGLVARYGGKAGSKWQVASFMKNTRKRHPGHWLYVRSPKSWKNTVQAAPGSASEKAQHFMHFGEMDSTPADVICNDGKRYAIIGFIDVYSRKVMFEVAPTSNQWAIRALLWRLWGTFGVPENLTVDHGKDYQAKSLHEAFACVGTRTAWIAPFAPESKGHIERMFRTVAEGLFEILPGFCGHNVTQRQEIREREKLYKRLCKRGEQVAVPLSPDELQQKLDQWTEYVYHQETHSGKGMKMSPNAKASLSPRQATIISDPADRTRLLAPNEERLVAKDGVHYNGRIYWADKLGPLIRNKVRVHQNMWDVSWVYCSDLETGEPICVAEDGSKSGKRRTPAEARQAKKIQKQERDAFMRLLNIKAKLNCSDPLEDAIVATRHQGGTIHNLSKGKEFENPFRYWPRDMTAGQIGHPETGVSEIKEEAFAEAEAGREPTAGRPRLCLVDAPQDSDLDELRFASSNDLFDYIMAKRQQKRGLTTTEETRLRETLPYWERYARLRIETLPRGDQVFLAKIAPESFGEYAEDEAVGGSH
jgi:transposase InsO family protein